MKKALLTLAAVALTSSVFAVDGTITFYNFDIPASTGGTYNPTIQRVDGTGAGAGYTAGLFLASNLTTPLATTTFRLNNNFGVFAITQDVTVTGVAPGSSANLVVRAWDTSAGSFDAAVTQGKQRGTGSFTSLALGGPNPTPGNTPFPTPVITGFQGFTMVVPEPSTYALAFSGIGALVMMARRRK